MIGESFIDVDFAQRAKTGQVVSGDVFLSRKLRPEGRIVSVLSDGLGSGVKAGVLANLTATMALRYTADLVDARKSAGIIMDTLPVCQTRKISYSTFTIIDLADGGRTRILEHGNPAVLVYRDSQLLPIERAAFTLERWQDRTITHSEFELRLGDRLVCCSDGITQSGLGRPGMPLGWGADRLNRFIADEIRQAPLLSAQDLCARIVAEALSNDGQVPRDDMTCGVIYYRQPRRLLVVTGPPFSRDRDPELANLVSSFPGRKVICGGTTANIVSRQLNRPVTSVLGRLDPDIPPPARMDGVDLVTEGTMTIARVAEMLERGPAGPWPDNPARDLMQLMLQSDIVQFAVGTRINEAHQDPSVPVELDLRRNIVRRIAALLETKYLKESQIQFL